MAKLDGIESSAIKIITRAIELERDSRLQPALTCYQEGIDLLLEVLKTCQSQEKKAAYRQKLTEYMTRAEQVKDLVKKQKQEGTYHEVIHIKEGDTGYSYRKIFGPYLDDTITEVFVQDAYIRSFHQVNNFLQLCELLVTMCPNLRSVNLTTSADTGHNAQQVENLLCIKRSLEKRNIVMSMSFSDSLHDREIRLNKEGWILKIGRGLDFYKRVERLSLGWHDLDLRLCQETTVDVFHSRNIKEMTPS